MVPGRKNYILVFSRLHFQFHPLHQITACGTCGGQVLFPNAPLVSNPSFFIWGLLQPRLASNSQVGKGELEHMILLPSRPNAGMECMSATCSSASPICVPIPRSQWLPSVPTPDCEVMPELVSLPPHSSLPISPH